VKRVLTRPAKRCEKLEDSAFNKDTYEVQIASRFIECVKVHIASADSTGGSFLTHEDLPAVLVIDKNGGELLLAKKNQCSRSKVYKAICSAVNGEVGNLSRVVQGTKRQLAKLYKLEIKLYGQDKKLSRLKKKSGKRFDKAVEERDELLEEKNKIISNINTVLKEDDTT